MDLSSILPVLSLDVSPDDQIVCAGPLDLDPIIAILQTLLTGNLNSNFAFVSMYPHWLV